MELTGHTTPATVQAIYDYYRAKRKNNHRPHLGGSQIGNPCSRALWYQFRWAWSPEFEGRILRLFETGDREEERLVSNLRSVGVTVWDRDPETGRQVSFAEHGGHFALSLDGVGEGFKESGKPHVLEFKTMNKKAFADVSRKGLQASKPVYWAQVQVGMHLSGLERAYFFAVEKDTDAIYAERVRLDSAEAMKLIAKAGQVIFAETPPARLSDDPAHWECKFCPYYAVCHGCKIPEVHCRTCAHVTPERDGTWSCARGRTTDKACGEHLFIPQAMPPDLEVHDAGETWVEYMDKDTGEIVRNEGNSVGLHNDRRVRG